MTKDIISKVTYCLLTEGENNMNITVWMAIAMIITSVLLLYNVIKGD